jgi:hypothetical protein
MVNIGPGIAFVAKGQLAMGSVIVLADAIERKGRDSTPLRTPGYRGFPSGGEGKQSID